MGWTDACGACACGCLCGEKMNSWVKRRRSGFTKVWMRRMFLSTHHRDFSSPALTDSLGRHLRLNISNVLLKSTIFMVIAERGKITISDMEPLHVLYPIAVCSI